MQAVLQSKILKKSDKNSLKYFKKTLYSKFTRVNSLEIVEKNYDYFNIFIGLKNPTTDEELVQLFGFFCKKFDLSMKIFLF